MSMEELDDTKKTGSAGTGSDAAARLFSALMGDDDDDDDEDWDDDEDVEEEEEDAAKEEAKPAPAPEPEDDEFDDADFPGNLLTAKNNDKGILPEVEKLMETEKALKKGKSTAYSSNTRKKQEREKAERERTKRQGILMIAGGAVLAVVGVILIFAIPGVGMVCGAIACAVAAALIAIGVLRTVKSKAPSETDELAVGDVVCFGEYEQEENSDKRSPIEWIVLQKEGEDALLISKSCIDCRPYNDDEEEIDWGLCTLRRWLNYSFLREAFSSEQRDKLEVVSEKNDSYKSECTEYDKNINKRIKKTGLTEEDDPGLRSALTDKVFLLSTHEAEVLFETSRDRRASATPRAKLRGAFVNDFFGAGCWWLRTGGGDEIHASMVATDGSVEHNGNYVNYGDVAIRPAIYLNVAGMKKEKA